MVLHLVALHEEFRSLLELHLRPVGLEVRLFSDPAKLAADLEALDPEMILFHAGDFPRHWKALLGLLRATRGKEDAVFILIAGEGFDAEEAAKASHLGVNGIVGTDVTERPGIARLVELLRRHKELQDKRRFTRYVLEDTDRIALAFIHPASGAVICGEVEEASVRGLSFLPNRPECTRDIAVGTPIEHCSLRVGETLLEARCRLMRSGRDLGLQFESLSEGGRAVLQSYLLARPERALKAAVAAGRQDSSTP